MLNHNERSESLDERIARVTLDLFEIDELSALANEILQQGYDSVHLWRLATSPNIAREEGSSLFHQGLHETSLPILSRAESARLLAKAVAKNVLTGVTPPYDGAKYVWHVLYTQAPESAELRVFVGLASEYEDDERRRSEYIQDIRDEFRRLLAGD